MKKVLFILSAIVATAALAFCLTSCKKDDPEQGPDWTKVQLDGTVWQIDTYSANLNGAASIWDSGDDGDITKIMNEGEVHFEFTGGWINFMENPDISTPYSWNAAESWLAIGYDEYAQNEAKVEFTLSSNKEIVYMTWDSSAHGAYPLVYIKAHIDADKLLK